jgi:cytochrome c oxidase assembly protein subunit 15
MSVEIEERMTTRRSPDTDLWIGRWLFAVAAMIFVMVVLGGLTRLTHSGLSMVEWRPISGWLPPLSEREWQATFDAYRQYPEYNELNFGMSLAGFKAIFWLEYVHRVWGRMIGVVFLVPLLVFLIRGWVDRSLGVKLGGLFVLGGLQGALGWFMVASGLIDRPDVSQYRLVAHLGLAVLIYGAIIGTAFDLVARSAAARSGVRPMVASPAVSALPSLPPRGPAFAVLGLIFLTILAGGFVAGTDAGFAYNTFPTMDGAWLPQGLFALEPFYRNFFEDLTTVQFTHRILATLTLLSVLGWCLSLRHAPRPVAIRAAILALAVVCQYTLGALTVVLVVPVPIAALHQAGALTVWTAALWTTVGLLNARRVSRATSPMRGGVLAGT